MTPDIVLYASVTKSKNEVCIIEESHLKRINKRQFRKELGKRLRYFKCISGANTKQLNSYIVLTLETINIEDLAQEISDIGLNCKSYRVSRIAISSILTRSSAQLNQVIGKVNDLLKSLFVKNGFNYISNEMIVQRMSWKEGIHLANDGTKIWHIRKLGSETRHPGPVSQVGRET